MDFREYVHIARRRWKIIFGSVFAAIGCAALLTALATPTYSSSARLFVSAAQGDSTQAYQGSLFSAQRIGSYADLVRSRGVGRAVIQDLGLQTTPSKLAENISSTVVPETVILEITARDTRPRQAQRIAQSVAREVSTLVSTLETPPGRGRAPIKATIVDAAELPTTPTTPQPLRNMVLAGVLGLLLGLGAAIIKELLDSTVKSPQDVADAADVPVMGNIAYDPAAAKRPLVTTLDLHNPRLEAFRVLRTNMQFVDVDNESRVYTVTSSIPEEGKTTTATNLAIMIAQAGQRVLLIEGDLRRPRIHLNSDLEQAVGLTTVLVGRTNLEDAVQRCEVPNLSVLTSGVLPPNPAELLQSRAMADVLEKARKSFDVVIIDAPPLLPVTDAALLAVQSDGALLVVRHGKTTKEQLHHSVERLRAVGGRPLGAVLNMIPSRGSAYYYTYRGDGYRQPLPLGPDGSDQFLLAPDADRHPEDTTTPSGGVKALAHNGRPHPPEDVVAPLVPDQRLPVEPPLEPSNGSSAGTVAAPVPGAVPDTRSLTKPSFVDTDTVRAVDHRGWDGLVRRLGGDAMYQSLGYNRASAHLEPEGTTPVLLHHRGRVSETALPLLMRPLPDGSGWDAITAYGLGGPISNAAAEDPELGAAVDDWARRNNLVASFIRYHPLLGNDRLGPSRVDVSRQGYTAMWDLARRTDLMAGMHTNHRRSVQRADHAGLQVRVTRSPRDLDAFRALYESRMERQGDKEFDFLSDRYWAELTRGCARNLLLLEAFLDTNLVAAILCLTSPPTLHYHLGASNDEGRRACASHRLFLAAAQWAKANGYSEFLLGGLGGATEFPLTFTQRFDPVTLPRPLYVGKWVHDPARYEALTGGSSTAGVFPPWRAKIELQGGL